ncbi:MAG TPA: metallophosphoesterase [Candidatus Angelobacter sp.]
MRVFAISDLHVDFEENKSWVAGLSLQDYQHDVLICAGDVSHRLGEMSKALEDLRKRFDTVAYLPGNHELWVNGSSNGTSLEKFRQVMRVAAEEGVHTGALHLDDVALVPLHAWYDYSFGQPSPDLLQRWADYQMCLWPAGLNQEEITQHFLSQNQLLPPDTMKPVISFSHFVPRSDLVPDSGTAGHFLRPVLGSQALDVQIRKLGAFMHVYGHYHVNGRQEREGVVYLNNALGYPREEGLSERRLLCIFET